VEAQKNARHLRATFASRRILERFHLSRWVKRNPNPTSHWSIRAARWLRNQLVNRPYYAGVASKNVTLGSHVSRKLPRLPQAALAPALPAYLEPEIAKSYACYRLHSQQMVTYTQQLTTVVKSNSIVCRD